jgi:phosphonate transport system substrate-binding protein
VQVDTVPGAPSAARTSAPPVAKAKLRFSVAAMQSPRSTRAGYSQLLDVLARRLGVGIEFVQRRTYAEVNEMLASGGLDAAIVCSGGYVDLERRFPGKVEILAVPVVRGESTYRSYLIVPTASRVASLADLRGRRFAFTDELSLSGHRYPIHLLRKARENPRSFFSSVHFTHSHDRSIEAVAKNVVDGASVDSLVFDQLLKARPWLSGAVRVVDRSPPFGAAPVVASTRLSEARRGEIQAALLALGRDPDGASALRVVGFDGFARPAPHLFDSAAAVMESHR